jgi:hypothetical protein
VVRGEEDRRKKGKEKSEPLQKSSDFDRIQPALFLHGTRFSSFAERHWGMQKLVVVAVVNRGEFLRTERERWWERVEVTSEQDASTAKTVLGAC